MRLYVSFLASIIVVGCSANAPPIPGTDVPAGTYEFTMTVDDIDRRYYVHIPPAYDGTTRLPVLLNFHGGGGTAKDAMKETQMHEASDEYGFIAVHPEGTGTKVLGRLLATWNAGECCASAMENGIDDVGFIAALLDHLETTYTVDTRRIYATGHSNGALFSYRLACELSDRIAAIAPNGSHDAFKECHPTRPVPVLHFHGTADPAAPYEGGTCGGLFAKALGLEPTEKDTWPCTSVQAYVQTWAERNRCNSQPVVTVEKGLSKCISYGQCNENADVTLCTLDGGGHTWPGGIYASNLQYYHDTVGPISTDLDANAILWEFFAEHPLP